MMWLLSLLPAKAAIKSFFRSWRPEMYALVAVIAVAGIATAIIGNLYISGQKDRIAAQAKHIVELTEVNKEWKENYRKQLALREVEHETVISLQEHVASMEKSSNGTEKQIAELRQINEEIRDQLNRPIPPDLLRRLQQ